MVQPGDRREFLKKAAIGSIALASVPTLGGVFAAPASAHKEDEGADKVRWDIVSLATNPLTFNPGGVAFASAPTHGDPPLLRIRFTGAGTFVAPASGGVSSGVTGGGTWETFSPAGESTGSGPYHATRLASWRFANMQGGTVVDNIGDTNKRANGSAVLLIKYSDGSRGILGVGCHGPSAPPGIHEGVIATKGFVTYWNSEGPAPGVDANRTVFHVGQEADEDDD